MSPRSTQKPRAYVVGGVVALAAFATVRPRLLRWGATDLEHRRPVAGDDVLPTADVVSTRAITIAAPPAEVWPWIAQLGQSRGGFYTHEWLENLAGADIHNADRIVAEWQDLAVGDDVHLAPTTALKVVEIEPGRSLVLHGGASPDGPVPPFEFSWAFALVDSGDGSTRLVVRERYRCLRRWGRAVVEPMAVASFVMTEGMLRGIRDRVEQPSRRT